MLTLPSGSDFPARVDSEVKHTHETSAAVVRQYDLAGMGERLRSAREAKGLPAMSKQNRVTNLKEIEAGIRVPRLQTLLRLVRQYGISLEWILSGQEPSETERQDTWLSPHMERLEFAADRFAFSRIAMGKQQHQVAGQFEGKIPATYINNYENTDVLPNVERLCSLAQFYGVSAAWLGGESNYGGPKEPSDFAGKVRCLRWLLDLSKEEIAEELGVSPTTILNFEFGRAFPRYEERLNSLASLLQVDPEWLASGQKPPSEAPGLRRRDHKRKRATAPTAYQNDPRPR